MLVRVWTVCLIALAAFALVDAAPTGEELYRSWTHALPANLFSRMEADCRAVHNWESNHVAALKDGKRVTRWFPINTFPRTALEEAILHLAKLANPGPRLVGFEWWIQKIAEQGPLNFHVDKDEAVASNEHYLLHPIWSSVFYVTNEGGGTLITNQMSPRGNGYEPVVAQEAAWSFPIENKFLRFNGTLLHGVTPGKQRGKFAKERITFLVNFWHVLPKQPNCQPLEHEKVTGLQLFSRDQIMALRAEQQENPSRPPVAQPLKNIDMRRNSDTDRIPFRMDLPGGQHQLIDLPDLEAKEGETFYIHYTSTKKFLRKAVKREKEARALVTKANRQWKKEQKRRRQEKKKAENSATDAAAAAAAAASKVEVIQGPLAFAQVGKFVERFEKAREVKEELRRRNEL